MKITLPILGLDTAKLLKTLTLWQTTISSAVYTLSQKKEAPLTVDASIAAIGSSSQTQGAKLLSEVSLVTTASAGVADSLQLPSLLNTSVRKVFIVNDTVAIINVYPAIGEKINGLAVNAGVQIIAGGSLLAYPNNRNNWIVGV